MALVHLTDRPGLISRTTTDSLSIHMLGYRHTRMLSQTCRSLNGSVHDAMSVHLSPTPIEPTGMDAVFWVCSAHSAVLELETEGTRTLRRILFKETLPSLPFMGTRSFVVSVRDVSDIQIIFDDSNGYMLLEILSLRGVKEWCAQTIAFEEIETVIRNRLRHKYVKHSLVLHANTVDIFIENVD
jgi:hypothetical protein